MNLKFILFKNRATIKEINVNINCQDLATYNTALNIFKKDINEYLTTLIDGDNAG